MPDGGGVRVDTGVYEGGEIPMYYDSMIAKLIVHGADRDDAIARDARGAQRLRHPRRRRATSRSRRRCWRTRSSSPATSTPASSPSTTAKGFRAEDVPHDDPDFLVALAAAAYRRYLRARRRHQRPARRATACASAATSSSSSRGEGGEHALRAGAHRGRRRHARSTVDGAQLRDRQATGSFGGIRASGTCNGQPFTAQVERHGLWLPRRRTTAAHRRAW
ncbi:MAG: hypothetical protein MZW92_73840 [Comamonadaceae bacterium]|nr:hypothetical protein [Comamonadaceae bacterium]